MIKFLTAIGKIIVKFAEGAAVAVSAYVSSRIKSNSQDEVKK